MGAPSPPKPPSAYEQANAQGAANEKAVYASSEVNAIPQYSPFGSVTYQYRQVQSPEYDNKGRVIGQRDYYIPSGQTTSLSPEVQALVDQQMQFGQQLGSKASSLLDMIPTDKFNIGDVGSGDQIAKTIYDRQMSLLQPQLDEQSNAQQVLLSDRGIPIGSEVWNDEMRRFETGREGAMSRLAQDADIMGRNEQQRLIQNALLERQMPYNEFAALQGQIPNFPTPQANPLPNYQMQAPPIGDYMQQNYQNQLAAHNASAGNSAAMMSGVLGILPALFSDERLKKDKKPVSGEAVLDDMKDVPVSEWEYTPEAQGALGVPPGRMTGPMAQDVHAHMGGQSPSLIDLGDQVGKMLAAIKALDRRTQNLTQRG